MEFLWGIDCQDSNRGGVNQVYQNALNWVVWAEIYHFRHPNRK